MGSNELGKRQSRVDESEDDVAVGMAYDRLAWALQGRGENEVSCAESRRMMPSLLAVAQGAVSLTEDMSQAQRHILACPRCAEEYRALLEAMSAYESASLPELEHRPHFDLSFLDARREPEQLWLGEAASKIRQLFTDVTLVVRRGMATFGPLPPILEVRTVSAGATRSDASAAREARVEVLVLPAPEASLCVQVSVGSVAGRLGSLAVKIIDLEGNQPMRDTRITLRNASRLLLVGSVTGQDGVSIFDQLPQGRYFVQLKHHDQLWEIPVVIVQENCAHPTPGEP